MPNFKPLVALAYYMPMSDTHATMAAVINRLDGPDSLTMHKSDAKARILAGSTLSMAHWLTLLTLDIQVKQFPELAPALESLMSTLDADFKVTWGPPEKLENRPYEGPKVTH